MAGTLSQVIVVLQAVPLVQYRKENRPTSRPEAFLDGEFHGTAAPIALLVKAHYAWSIQICQPWPLILRENVTFTF